MTQVNINRSFDHRSYGHIGTVEMTGEATFKIGDRVVPDQSVEYLVTFALQSLQDAYAGAESESDAKARFDKKLDRLLAGEIGTREGGGGVSEETKVARSIVRGLFKTKYAKADAKRVEFDAMDEKGQNAELDAMFERNAEKLQPAVDAELKRRADAKKSTKKLGGELDL